MLTRSWSIGCSPRRTTARSGAATGSTLCAIPNRKDSNTTATAPEPGDIATTSIDSFNRDKPYDQFVLSNSPATRSTPRAMSLRIAAGFNRLGPVRRNAGNQEIAFSRNEVMTEMADATGAVFLGLTVACARCHDHKFDDISLDDYYCFQSFWAATQEARHRESKPSRASRLEDENGQDSGRNQEAAEVDGRLTSEARTRAEERITALEASLPPTVAGPLHRARCRPRSERRFTS